MKKTEINQGEDPGAENSAADVFHDAVDGDGSSSSLVPTSSEDSSLARQSSEESQLAAAGAALFGKRGPQFSPPVQAAAGNEDVSIEQEGEELRDAPATPGSLRLGDASVGDPFEEEHFPAEEDDALDWEEWQPEDEDTPDAPARDAIEMAEAAADAAEAAAQALAGETGAATEAQDDDTSEDEEDDDGETFDLYGDETLLDEDALRDMVADLVREELQGVLGERITRNVRRLVRREIERALSMRDLK